MECNITSEDGICRCANEGCEFVTKCPPAGIRIISDCPFLMSVQPQESNDDGVGSQLAGILHAMDIPYLPTCACEWWIGQMNSWGADGCREHRVEIIEHLHDAKRRWGPNKMQFAKAALAAVKEVGFRLNPLDPVGSILDEAIRRAAALEGSHQPA